MSALRKQLVKIIRELSEEANKNHDREVKERYYFLCSVVRSKQSVTRACAKAGKSTDSFNLWGERLRKQKKLSALKGKSRAPKRSPTRVTKRVERKIIALRKAEPSNGAERISFDLKKLFGLDVRADRVYRVLKRNNLISKARSKRLTKRHIKRYRQPLPGYLQMDVKYVTYKIHGQQFYQFNVVDHCTTWRLTRVYRQLNHYNLMTFLKLLEARCPFPIIQIQTDNGMEFTDKYRGNVEPTGEHPLDQWCKARGIEHRLIPVGQKELNGKVENTHKQDDREFYAGSNYQTFEKLEKAMRGYNGRWNEVRATKALGWKTPDQAVEQAYVRALVCFLNLKKAATPVVEPPKPAAPQRKPKPLSSVDRYLQWLEWDDQSKKPLKAAILLPQMSRSYSGKRGTA
jgi:transposase InsO family protein